MNSVLVISSNKKSNVFFKECLIEKKCQNIYFADNFDIARKILLEQEFDLCLINAPIAKDNGLKFAKDVVHSCNCQVILLIKSNYFEEISYELELHGIFTLAKPINKLTFQNVLRMCEVVANNITKIKKENDKLQQKIEEIRIINQAKYLLIENANFNEEKAHYFLEKKAMDLRVKRRVIAEKIIEKYQK